VSLIVSKTDTCVATIDKVAWIQVENNRLLSTRSRGKKVFYVPGGKREAFETDLETLIREIGEELSVRIAPASARYFGTFSSKADGMPDGTTVKMTCFTGEFEGRIVASSEIQEVAWFTYREHLRCSAVDQIIMHHLFSNGVISY